jgi:hypothetical protein
MVSAPPRGCIEFEEPSFSPRLDALSIARHAPFPTSGRQRTWPRDVVYIALNAHQKLKVRLVSRGFRGEFESEVADGPIAEAI